MIASVGCSISGSGTVSTLSGSRRLVRPWSLVFSECETTRSLPAISASNPSRATSAGSSLSLAATLVTSMSARSKNSVSVGPGISEVIVTPLSSSSLCSASAKDCTNDFDAL